MAGPNSIVVRFLMLGFVARGTGGGPEVMKFGSSVVHPNGMLVSVEATADMAIMEGAEGMDRWGVGVVVVVVVGIGGIAGMPVKSSIEGRGSSIESGWLSTLNGRWSPNE